MEEAQLAAESLAKKIAGEIVLSETPGKTMQKWRVIFRASQKNLAAEMGITPSVISDYEAGRRESPGIKIIRKVVDALIRLDGKNGGRVVNEFSELQHTQPLSKAIIDIREFSDGIPAKEFCNMLSCDVVARKDLLDREIYGYTVIDAVKAIIEFSFADLVKLYGLTTKRALIFTNVSTGRSPMVAIKVTNLRPELVVLHGLKDADEVAKRIAEAEMIPLAISRLSTVDDIIAALKKRFE